jgi:polyhydroxyalkanoate synthase
MKKPKNGTAAPALEGKLGADLSGKAFAATAKMLNPATVDTLMDIAKRSGSLVQLYAEKLRTQDAPSDLDPRPLTATLSEFQDFIQKAAADPSPIIREQAALWSDLTLLWQRSAGRAFSNEPVEPVIVPAKQDKRFKNEAWTENAAFDFIKQNYLLMSRYVDSSVRGVKGVEAHTHRKAQFMARQFVSALSPTNFAVTNPAVLDATVETGGENLVKGLRNLVEDLERGGGRLSLKMSDLDAFKFGENIANTPGKVVFQNDLMQLIQYEPSTAKVHRRPLLIVPPWINKFYILDLKPENSFIRWCVERGHTVFVISWVNPGAELSRKDFADYMLDGPMAAVNAIERATGEPDVNAIGYCIGGTLLASTLAYMASTDDERRIASATLFTTLLDFSEVGDISVFIDEAQVQLADEQMNRLGYLEGHQMANAFNLMRENDLIWHFVVNNYLLGRDPAAFDLLYWNSDSTRMPAAMQSFYLKNMYLRNRLKEPGGVTLANVPIDLRKVDTPIYFLSAREDHIAPWQSTYAGAKLVSGPTRFVLGASGHIAGVINPPAAKKYGYWTNESLPEDSEAWLQGATQHQGSWWEHWAKWVAGHGGGEVAARPSGCGDLKVIEEAPGSYVRVRR